MRIHHATAAKAKKFGITLSVEENEVVATGKGGVRLASGLQGNKVLEDAITKMTGKVAKGAVKVVKPTATVDVFEAQCKEAGWKKTRWGFRNADDSETQPEATTWGELYEELGLEDSGAELDEDDSDADQSKSIVKAKYRAKYKPTKDKCGDPLSFRINEHVSREDDAGDMKTNLDALRTFAKANECWVPSYASFKSRTGDWNAGIARMNVANRLRARLRRIAKEQERAFDIETDVVWA